MAKGAYIGVPLQPLASVAVGSTVKLKENGVPVDYLVVHQGNPDVSIYDASCDGVWLLRKDLYGKRAWSTVGDFNSYADGNIHPYLNGDFLGIYDVLLQNAIKQVKIPYRAHGGPQQTITGGSRGLSAKIFLLSSTEVCFSNAYMPPNEGAVLDYFAGCNQTGADSKRVGYLDGATTGWWLRSPYTSSSSNSYAAAVFASGSCGNNTITNEYGLRPAMIVPYDMAVFADGLISGAAVSSANGVARKIKKGYVGISGVARKIKKAYIGIGGVARPCWAGGGKLEYYGTITELSTARAQLAATTIGGYALFGGGNTTDSTTFTAEVNAYNNALTRTTPTALSRARSNLAATAVGDYALFGGGYVGSGSNVVDAYDKSLTRTKPTALSVGTQTLAATTIGNYALFGGGTTGSNSAVVNAYDKSLTRTTPTALSVGRYTLAATAVGNYALFGGGNVGDSYGSNVVDAYDKSLTRSTPSTLLSKTMCCGATSVGDYALFAGGYTDGNPLSIVTAYNASLTRSNPSGLNTASQLMGATSVANYALFGGGAGKAFIVNGVVTAYDESLTVTAPTVLSGARYNMGATSVGDYALFAGGAFRNMLGSTTPQSAVDVYAVV